MKNQDQSGILFYSQNKNIDELAISLVTSHFANFSITSNSEEILSELYTPVAKVLLISCEQLNHSIEIYDQILEKMPTNQLLNHKIVFLVHKHEESQAYQVYLDGMSDDYIVSKPIYEKHRLINIIRHLLIELGDVDFSTIKNYKGGEEEEHLGYGRKHIAVEKYNRVMKQTSQQISSLKSDIKNDIFSIDKLKLNFESLHNVIKQYSADEQKSVHAHLMSELINLTEVCLSKFVEKTNNSSDVFNCYSEKTDHSVNKTHQILLVEDDPWSAKLVTNILRHGKYALDQVVDGRSALKKIGTVHYDLILMDIGLPDSDGAALISQLRNNPGENTMTPVIMLTGAKDHGTIKRCAANKIQGYLVKPVAKNHLLKKLSDVLGVEQ